MHNSYAKVVATLISGIEGRVWNARHGVTIRRPSILFHPIISYPIHNPIHFSFKAQFFQYFI